MRTPSTAAGDAAPTPGLPVPGHGWPARLGGQARRLPALAGRHWVFTALLTAGLVLRILAQIAYRPALLYIDSTKYLLGAYPGDDPPGYQFAIKPVLALGNLGTVAAIQHLLGLAMAVTIYLVLLRRGVPRWLAALATAPVLLDGYQLQIEQTIMPDVMFEALLAAAVAALLWHPRARPWMIVTAGLALGAGATAFEAGEILILPALLYVLITVPGWRVRLQQAVVLCVAFAVPVAAVSYRNYVTLHRFSLAPRAGGSIYGRLAEAADCATLKLPADERPLCPSASQKLSLGPDGLNHSTKSPIRAYGNLPALVGNFDHQVLKQQPLNVVVSVGKDATKLFALHRVTSPGDTPITRWQFQAHYPQYKPYIVIRNGTFVFGTFNTNGTESTIGTGAQFGGGSPVVIRPLASFLRAYQLDGGYTPGPLFLFAFLAGLAGSLAVLRRRAPPAQRAAALACLLFFTSGVAILLASDLFEFSWRYQLPALITLPPAAALAITVVLTRRTGSAGTAGGEMVLDPLEAGHGQDDDQAERDEHDHGQPGRGGLHDDAAKGRTRDDGGQDAQAALHPVRLAAGDKPGDETGESTGQVGR
jgi:Dolichyl-phosphate-mannose-protein mannosyltransferase